MEDFVTVGGKKYRKGYTTGSCAAAASKAAVVMLVSGTALSCVEIDTPAGIRLTLPVDDIEISGESVKCSIIKDGGDDPDVTSGLKIFAEARFTPETPLVNAFAKVGFMPETPSVNTFTEARFTPETRISIKAGKGIGIVTLPGLKVKAGLPAINPVPVKMIMKEVDEVLPADKGVEITLSIPGGEEAALKTYNPKLGITGGISILGTSGIVEPMSEEAWKESLALELGIMAAKGSKQAVFIFGNYGEDFVTGKLGISSENIVKISNFVGFMLDKAVEYGIERLVLAGHPGKLVKVAAGIFHTHSRMADARMEIMTSYAALEGAAQPVVQSIYACKTTEAAMDIINRNGLTGVYDRIVDNASRRCMEYTFGKIKAGAVLFDAAEKILAIDRTAIEMLKSDGIKINHTPG